MYNNQDMAVQTILYRFCTLYWAMLTLYWATKIVLGQVNLAQQNGPREEAAGTVQLETLEKHEMHHFKDFQSNNMFSPISPPRLMHAFKIIGSCRTESCLPNNMYRAVQYNFACT